MAYFETADRCRTYYEHHKGNLPAVVLIHGWGMSGEYWSQTVEAVLAQGHGAIVIDHRGCGRSDRDFSDLSIDAIADDVVGIVKQCGVNAVVLNGWSLGAAVAVKAAHLLGDKAVGLVLTCGASPCYVQKDGFPHGGTADDVRAIPDAITSNRAAFFRGLAQGAVAEGTDVALVDWCERGFIASGPRVSDTLLGLIELDQREMLSELECPVLSIGGGKDAIADPAIAGFAAHCAQNGTLVTFENCGHSPHLEDAPAYNAALCKFLGGLS